MEEYQTLDVAITSDPVMVLPAPPHRRHGWQLPAALLSWLLIGVMVFAAAFGRYFVQEQFVEVAEEKYNGASLVVFQMQSHYIVGGCDAIRAPSDRTQRTCAARPRL